MLNLKIGLICYIRMKNRERRGLQSLAKSAVYLFTICSHIIRKNAEKHNKFRKTMSYKWLNNANFRNGAQRLKIE